MFKTYRAVFRAPGSAAFATAGVVMRMPIAIYPLALVLIVSGRTGHYGFAGVVSACYIAGGVPGGPLLARLVDRYGQGALLLPATAVHLAAVLVLAVLLEAAAPDWTLVAPAVVAGFAYLSVGSLIRARWSVVLAGKPELVTAYSLESTLDELIFVVGPLIATLIATHTDPVVSLYVAMALIAVGAVWLSTQRGTEPPAPPRGRSAAPLGAARARHAAAERGRGGHGRGVRQRRDQHGRVLRAARAPRPQRGGGGDVRRRQRVCRLRRTARAPGVPVCSMRYRLQASIFAVLPFLFLLATNVGVLAVCAFVVGLSIAPDADHHASGSSSNWSPRASLTEGLTWIVTGLSIGYGAGAAVVGGIADAHGARTAFGVTVVAGLLSGAVGWLLHRQLRAPDGPRQTPVGSSRHAALP